MKAEIGIDESGQFYLRVNPGSDTEATLLKHASRYLGLSYSDFEGAAVIHGADIRKTFDAGYAAAWRRFNRSDPQADVVDEAWTKHTKE